VEIRGNKSYDHVKELEERGLINAEKFSRTKLLTTTRSFADYFGISSADPQAIRRALLKDKRLVGVSPMYESLALRLALDYIVVNPYKPEAEDLERLKEIELLVLAPGYTERVKQHYSGQMLEAGVATLSQLKESAERLRGCRAVSRRGGLAAQEIPAESENRPGHQAAHPHDRGNGPRPAPACAGRGPDGCARLCRNKSRYPDTRPPALRHGYSGENCAALRKDPGQEGVILIMILRFIKLNPFFLPEIYHHCYYYHQHQYQNGRIA
jgi:hypothetical protein